MSYQHSASETAPTEHNTGAADESDNDQTESAEQLVVQLAHAEDQWRRTAADLDNLQKRFRRELERGRAEERQRVLSSWIETIDDLERSLEHSSDDNRGVSVGVRSIIERSVAAVAALGFARFGTVGDDFDPAVHEVISTVPGTDAAPGQIVAIVKPGYGTADALLRPAAVVVAAEVS